MYKPTYNNDTEALGNYDTMTAENCRRLLSDELYRELKNAGFTDDDLIRTVSLREDYFKQAIRPFLSKLFERPYKQEITYEKVLNRDGFGVKELIPFFSKKSQRLPITVAYLLCELSPKKDAKDVDLTYWELFASCEFSAQDLLERVKIRSQGSQLEFLLLPAAPLHTPTYVVRPLDVFLEAGLTKQHLQTIMGSNSTALKKLFEFVCLIQCKNRNIFPHYFEHTLKLIEPRYCLYSTLTILQNIFSDDQLFKYVIENRFLDEIFYYLTTWNIFSVETRITMTNFEQFFPLISTKLEPASKRICIQAADQKMFKPMLKTATASEKPKTENLLRLYKEGFTSQELELSSDRLEVLLSLITIQRDRSNNPLLFNGSPSTYLTLFKIYGFTNADILSILNQENGAPTLKKCMHLVAFIYFKKLLLHTNWLQPVIELANSPDRANHLDLLGRILARHAKKIDEENLLERVCSNITSKTAEECREISPQMFKLFFISGPCNNRL